MKNPFATKRGAQMLLSTVAAGLLVALAVGHSASRALAQTAAPADLLARGEYLTGDAGQCADCHNAQLQGGPNKVKPRPGVPWADTVPSLRGLKMFATDADALTFLRTGALPDGSKAKAPMPGYRFNQADATAIVAYLRSLK
jgi:mono/diheme cytochrome c family protein